MSASSWAVTSSADEESTQSTCDGPLYAAASRPFLHRPVSYSWSHSNARKHAHTHACSHVRIIVHKYTPRSTLHDFLVLNAQIRISSWDTSHMHVPPFCSVVCLCAEVTLVPNLPQIRSNWFFGAVGREGNVIVWTLPPMWLCTGNSQLRQACRLQSHALIIVRGAASSSLRWPSAPWEKILTNLCIFLRVSGEDPVHAFTPATDVHVADG